MKPIPLIYAAILFAGLAYVALHNDGITANAPYSIGFAIIMFTVGMKLSPLKQEPTRKKL
jgi:hypothetical protein